MGIGSKTLETTEIKEITRKLEGSKGHWYSCIGPLFPVGCEGRTGKTNTKQGQQKSSEPQVSRISVGRPSEPYTFLVLSSESGGKKHL